MPKTTSLRAPASHLKSLTAPASSGAGEGPHQRILRLWPLQPAARNDDRNRLVAQPRFLNGLLCLGQKCWKIQTVMNDLNGRPEGRKQPACRASGAFGNGDNRGGRMIKQSHQRIQKTAAQAIMDTGINDKIDMDAWHDAAVADQQTADYRQKRRLFQMREDNVGLLFSQILSGVCSDCNLSSAMPCFQDSRYPWKGREACRLKAVLMAEISYARRHYARLSPRNRVFVSATATA